MIFNLAALLHNYIRMSVLILKNISSEGPGTIEHFLVQSGFPYTIADLTRGEFPDASAYDTLVMMGGPMSVNESYRYPYIDREAELAQTFMAQDKKVLGICLGAQIMAKTLGARVYPGTDKEIGWYDIELVDGGVDDWRMKLLASDEKGTAGKTFRVFHWHGETFDIPQGAVRLAQSLLYPNQAFRFDRNAYAFQFHIEVTERMIFEWLRHEAVDFDRIGRDTAAFSADYARRAKDFYKAFFTASGV